MASTCPDQSLVEYLFDGESLVLKENPSDDVFMQDSVNDPMAFQNEEWMAANTDDFFDSMFSLDDRFNLIDNDLEPMPSSSSDSGLSSALSLSCEQQLSPLLPTEDDPMEDAAESIKSPQSSVDFSPTGSTAEPALELDTSKPQIMKEPPTATIISPTCKKTIRKLIRVTPGNQARSILLPVSLKDMKEVRAVKIITAAQARNLKKFKISPINQASVTKPSGEGSSESSVTSQNYPPLKLNAEEKRLLQKEGITLPSHYPLTRGEERELKRIRRKIRNKVSAQDSRKRKKEYVDGLEERVKQCTEENMTLLTRIKALQAQNQRLAGQLKRLQPLIQKGNKSVQPATCLMVLLLSLALVAVPNLRPNSKVDSSELAREESEQPLAGRSRSLLFAKQLIDEELQQYDELLAEVEGDHDYSQVVPQKRARYDDDQPSKHIAPRQGFNDAQLGRKYIDPPLDDVWPPPKPEGEKPTRVVDKLEMLTNELKINISDADGTRVVVLKVPQGQGIVPQ